MERDGQLVFTRRQCYALPERLDLLKGTVIGHRDGFGFLRVEGRKDDLYLSSEQMKMCIHGDQIPRSRWELTVKAAAKRAWYAFWCQNQPDRRPLLYRRRRGLRGAGRQPSELRHSDPT